MPDFRPGQADLGLIVIQHPHPAGLLIHEHECSGCSEALRPSVLGASTHTLPVNLSR
jgi:hypothetical protein